MLSDGDTRRKRPSSRSEMLAGRALDSDWALTVEVTGSLPNILITTDILTPRGNLLWNENLKGMTWSLQLFLYCIDCWLCNIQKILQEKADLF